MPVRVIIFEDNVKLRNSITSLFQYSEKHHLVAAYENVLNAEEIIKQDNPDVILLDIDMPKMNGIAAIPVIKNLNPLISVIMYTQFEDDEKLFNSLCAGADGYILKSNSPLKLFDAIEEVRAGGIPLSPAVAKKVLHHFHMNDKKCSIDKYGLTERESQVLQLLVKGYSIKQLASDLNIAYNTCRSHLRNIYYKLHVSCGKEAIAKILVEKIKF